jgi:hypothetical protein
MTEDFDLARPVGLDPDRRTRRVDVAQQRTEEKASHLAARLPRRQLPHDEVGERPATKREANPSRKWT